MFGKAETTTGNEKDLRRLQPTIGKIGASLDEVHDLDYLAETAPRGKERSVQAAADRAQATRLRGQAMAIADGLSEEDRVLVAHVGGPRLKGFVTLGVLP